MGKTLVTGGAGFIGRQLVELLLGEEKQVRVIDPAVDQVTYTREVDCRAGSILDESALRSALDGVDELYHLAAYPHLWARDQSVYTKINAEGTAAVLRVAEEVGVSNIVVSLTEAILIPRAKVYSDPLSDEAMQSPNSLMLGPYSISKRDAERVAYEAAQAGAPIKLVYPTVPFGKGDIHLTPPAAMLKRFLKGDNPAYLECILNVVDVRNVAMGHLLAARKGKAGGRYLLGGENLLLSEILSIVEKASGKKMPRRKVPGFVALGMAHVYELFARKDQPPASVEGVRLALAHVSLDNQATCDALGWESGSAKKAIEESVRWLLEGDR